MLILLCEMRILVVHFEIRLDFLDNFTCLHRKIIYNEKLSNPMAIIMGSEEDGVSANYSNSLRASSL